MSTQISSDPRSMERIRAHYEVEIELADRLRHAPKAARKVLYGQVSNELFRRVPDHPQLARRADPGEPRGFHLAEYTYAQLTVAFKDAGFRRVRVLERSPARLVALLVTIVSTISSAAGQRIAGLALALPAGPYLAIERLAGRLPRGIVRRRVLRRLLGINIVAER